MGAFLEQLEELVLKKHQYNLTWIFAKIYRRSFLDKWNIQYPDMRANEDVGFNLLVWACINDVNKINIQMMLYICGIIINKVLQNNRW